MIIEQDIMNHIINDYQSGLNTEKLSEKYNDYSPYIIRENLKKYSVFRKSKITNEELELIKTDYINGMSLLELSKKYNRPKETIRKKLQSINMYNARKQSPYTNDEIDIIKKYYPIGDWNSLFKLLPDRTIQSIQTKAAKLQIKSNTFHWDKEKISKILSEKKYNLLSEFSTTKNKHKIIDTDGYLYYVPLDNLIYNKEKPLKFSISNKYTIDNIKTYIKCNNIDCQLLSEKYNGNTEKMKWKCSCGNVFLCTWADFYQGKHWCNKCANKIIYSKKSYSIDQVKALLNDTPYTMIEDTFTHLSDGFTAITKEGYKVLMNGHHVIDKQIPEVFHKNNPFTIENIENYIKLHSISTQLISKEYVNNRVFLEWKCSCGKIFKRSWNQFYDGAVECFDCSSKKSGIKRRKNIDEIKRIIKENGFYLDGCIDNISISSKKFSIYDDEGYFYETSWSNMKNNIMPERFHNSNKYTLQNINLFLKIHRNGEYECIDDIYVSNNKKMKFIHKPCGNIFYATLVEMQGRLVPNKKEKYCKQCPKCNTNKTESNHASVLKQIFLHEYPDTILEDKSCINPKTNYPLPTDIVNHKLKIAIEIQSSYHDTNNRKVIDKFKKEFWIEQGYNFFDPDIRDYSILEMVQIFFPNIHVIPDYIDYNFSDCIDFTKIQSLLNDGKTIFEISNIMGIKSNSIRGIVSSRKVTLPKGYKNKVQNIKAIVRLSKSGEFIERFDSLSDAIRNGYASGTIRRVLIGKQDFSYDSFWVYEKDYLLNNYIIPKEKEDPFTYPVAKYDIHNNFVCNYPSIYEAEKHSNSNRSEIYRVVTGKRKSSHQERWKFTNTA